MCVLKFVAFLQSLQPLVVSLHHFKAFGFFWDIQFKVVINGGFEKKKRKI